tara:strand:+ start:107 stop:292 length:186 start_codon:yes stop_codon:yes gene_type:complete
MTEQNKKRPKRPKWFEALKTAGPVTTTAPGTEALMNQKVIAPKEEEEEHPVVPKEADYWRD